jgi:hypothetical protein
MHLAMSDDSSFNQQQFLRATGSVLDERFARELYLLLDRIALEGYEDVPSAGYMALCPAGSSFISPDIILETPMLVRNVRGLRKMLHITMPTLAGLCDGKVLYGFGNLSTAQAILPVLKFQWPGIWQLTKDGAIVAQTKLQQDRPKGGDLRDDRFCAAVQQVFGPLSTTTTKHLRNLIMSATQQSWGTNVLISANAAAEAARLNSQCTKVNPFELTPAVMEQITALDGSVLIDPDGVCHAIGAILDGGVSERGDRARGGRYNSAVMYVECCSSPSLIVVVSQDKTVDLVFRQPSQLRS